MAMSDHAVLVGIDHYPGFTDLDGPGFDCSEFEAWLVDPDGGAVPPANVRRVSSSPDSPGQPGKDGIDGLFAPLVTHTLSKGRVGQRLYIYLAGHGFSDPRDMDSAALYAANASPFVTPHIAGTLYANWFRRNGGFDEIVLIMDCCRSVSELTNVLEPSFASSRNLAAAPKVRTFYAYATEWGFETRETTIGGRVRGVFTAALLNALRNAAPNDRDRVTGQRIKDFIHNALSGMSPPPVIEVDTHRDIAFATRQAGKLRHVVVRLQPADVGRKVEILDGMLEVVEELGGGSTQVEAQLPPGIYKARIAGSSRSRVFEVVSEDVDVVLD